jgi:hypothetical protein
MSKSANSRNWARFRSVIVTMLLVIGVNMAISYTQKSGITIMPDAPRPTKSGITIMPDAPRPTKSGITIMPDAPRPAKSGITIMPDAPRPQ